MKKIVRGKDLQEKILESINIICGTVKETLGPKGNNVLIDHSNYSPFITNDGVTIANNIESEDETIGAILEIIKEASIKTNETVGDGTTTTLCLLESLYTQSIQYIEKGFSPILLKKELDKTLEIILNELQKIKKKANIKDLKNIACISAGDEEIGNLAYQVINKVKQKEAVTIKEISQNKNSITYYKGYTCETTLASPYFLRDTNTLCFKDSYILLINQVFTDLENVSFILNDIIKNNKNLIIIANNFDENIVEELVSLTLTTKANICLLKIEEYGTHVYEIMKDLEQITNAKIIEYETNTNSKDIGLVEKIEITKENIRINFKSTQKIKYHLAKLKKEAKKITNELEKNFYEKRIAMFNKGTAQINLSAPTKTEVLEKRMRLEDALCALSVSHEGILPGCGISLLQISKNLDSTNEVNKIWKKTLRIPFEQIMINAGLNFNDIQNLIEKENYKSIFNISTGTLEDYSHTKVIDPYLVVKHSLINATSIASMLITTTSLIINEYQNNNNKENEYNNW